MTTCKTHKNISAEVVKGQRVTLEESVKQNKTFKKDHPQIVQLSAPRDQLVYIARKGLVDVATIAYNKHHDLVWRPDRDFSGNILARLTSCHLIDPSLDKPKSMI